jgi:hypothetical protein
MILLSINPKSGGYLILTKVYDKSINYQYLRTLSGFDYFNRMAVSNNNGWDFIKAGNTYQYKEGSFIAEVTILEDSSDNEYYRFNLRVEKSTYKPSENGEFEVIGIKGDNGYYSGMLQFFESPEYQCDYKWERAIDFS